MNTIEAKQLGDKYILLDMLGIGGMAEVYRAKQVGKSGFEKQIVIKKLLPQVAQDSEMVRLFIGEARLAAMLQHENIAATYDFGEIDGCHFLAMEYLSGVDLHTLLTRTRELEKPLELRYALMIAAKICEGMDYAHRLTDFQNKPLNLIHRDLTPHNIFITYDGKVKVFDFGVAKAEILDNKTQVGIVKGKLSYMSPEQISGEKIDSRSDIFSIGILLYEMLSGRRMYKGDTATLIQKCLTADYQRLQEILPDLPAELYRILDKALEREREKRYQSCAQVQADIEDLMFSLDKRTDSKSLQSYIRGLFAVEYKAALEKATLAMDSSATVVSPAQQDKTVILQTGADDKTTVYDTGKEERDRRKGGIGARILTNKWVLLSGAGLALILLAAVVIPELFRKENTPIPASSSITASNAPSAASSNNIIDDQAKLLAELTEKAERSVAANHFVEPADDCALKYYKEILKRDPQNARALEGLNTIADYLATQAELEYKESHVKEAGHYVDLGLQIVPGHERLLELKRELANLETADRFADLAQKAMSQGRIAEARDYIDKGLAESPRYERLLALKAQNIKETEAAVSKLTAKARQRLEENKLTTPLGDSALSYLNEIKRIDPDNVVVSRGYQEIGDRYASLADDAYRRFNVDSAKEYVNKGLEIVPNHRRLLALKAELSRSKPAVFINSVEKNIRTLFGN